MQFGMPTLLENRTPEANADLCRRLGLQFVELNMNFPEYGIDCLEQTDELIRIAKRAGIYYTVHLDENLNIADFNPLVAEAYLETVRRTVAALKKLLPLRDANGDGSQPLTVNMHLHHGIYVTLPDRKEWLYERDKARYLASFERFRDLCAEWIGNTDIRIAVENTNGFKPFEKQAVDRLLASPVFGLTWDVGHSAAAGEEDLPFILEREDRLIHFHLHDGTREPPRNHLALGDGRVDLEDRLAVAKRRQARCVLETKTSAALERSVCWLQEKGWKPE